MQRLYRDLFGPEVIAGSLAKVEALAQAADRLRLTRAQLAVAWAIHQAGVTGVICGTRSAKRARENAAAASVELSPDYLAAIDTVLV